MWYLYGTVGHLCVWYLCGTIRYLYGNYDTCSVPAGKLPVGYL